MESYDEENYLAYRSFNPIKLPISGSWSPMVKPCISGIYAYFLFCRAVSILMWMGHFLHRLGLFQKHCFLAILSCLFILPHTFPPHARYHKWHLHILFPVVPHFELGSFVCLCLLSHPLASSRLPSPLLHSLLRSLCLPWSELEPRHFSSSTNLCSHRATFFLALFCVVWFPWACVRHRGVPPSLDPVPDSLRIWVYRWQDVSAEALGMWVFAVIYIHGWMQRTWSRTFCFFSSHREIWLKSPASVCMCDCVSFSADGQTCSE